MTTPLTNIRISAFNFDKLLRIEVVTASSGSTWVTGDVIEATLFGPLHAHPAITTTSNLPTPGDIQFFDFTSTTDLLHEDQWTVTFVNITRGGTTFDPQITLTVTSSVSDPSIVDYVVTATSITVQASFVTKAGFVWQDGDVISCQLINPPNIYSKFATVNQIFSVGNPLDFAFDIPTTQAASMYDFTLKNVTREALPDGAATIARTFFSVPTTPCFLEGTLIRTSASDVPVESLKAGDSVLSAGTLKDRSLFQPYECLSEKKVTKMVDFEVTTFSDISRPIKIKAGALGENLPEQDLFVSPWHGIIVDGVLKNANTLLNGDTIAYDYTIKSAHYYHVELEEHSVILANGANTESYYDDEKDFAKLRNA